MKLSNSSVIFNTYLSFNGNNYFSIIEKKTTKTIPNFCNEFTSNDPYKFDRVVELSYVRDYIIKVLSESEFWHKDNRIRVVSIIDNISLRVMNEDFKSLEQDLSNLRICFFTNRMPGKLIYREKGIKKNGLIL